MKTPPQFVDRGVPANCESRRISNVHYAFRDDNALRKTAYLSTMFTLEASGAIAQIGDAAGSVDRFNQDVLAAMQGITRSTLTRRISLISAPEHCPKCGKAKIAIVAPDQLRCVDCKHEFQPRWTQEKRRKHSAEMKKIAATHPHWRRSDEQETEAATEKDGDVDRQEREKDGAASLRGRADEEECRVGKPIPNQHGQDSGRDQTSNNPKRKSGHVGCILTRNAGFGAANLYAYTMPDEARPGLKAYPDPTAHAKILAEHFGEDVYDPTAEVNGWNDSWGCTWNEHFPDAPDCICKEQKSFEFQERCPKCEGKGYVIGGSMRDTGRVLLHFLNVRGIDREIRHCDRCKRSYDHRGDPNYPNCRGCGQPGRVLKEKGVLQGWPMRKIAKVHHLNKSTVCEWFKRFRRLELVRSVPCRRWRECCGIRFDEPACPKCGNKTAPIKKSEPQKHLWLLSRRFDRDLVKAEKKRLEDLVLRYRFLNQQQKESLKRAVQLALKLLSEWAGQEHQLQSFYSEMRRRLNTVEYGRFLAVLFPPNTS